MELSWWRNDTTHVDDEGKFIRCSYSCNRSSWLPNGNGLFVMLWRFMLVGPLHFDLRRSLETDHKRGPSSLLHAPKPLGNLHSMAT
jgi:hypothetical protein